MSQRFSLPLRRAMQRALIACVYLSCLVGCGSSEREPESTAPSGSGSSTGHVNASSRAMGGGSGEGASARGGQGGSGSLPGRSTVGNGGAPIQRSTASDIQTSGSSEPNAIGGTGTGSGGSNSRSITSNGNTSSDPKASSGGTAAASKSSDTARTAGGSTGGKNSGATSLGGNRSVTSGATIGGSSSDRNTTAGGTSGATAGGNSEQDLCPSGITRTITVGKDGGAEYATVQAAIDSIANNSSAAIRVNIKAGTYTEKLIIANRSNLCLVGEDTDKTILTYGDSNGSVGSTSGSASVHVSANDFSAARLTFRNSYGAGSQAVALRTTGQRQQFLDCRLIGYQDTLYVHSGTQYFRNCYVQGNTDYVFGGATAILQDCEVRNVQKGSAVAAPNTASSTAYGIVFLGGHFTAESGVSNVALARPWGADGAAAFLAATLDGHISAEGFTVMSGNDPANARFNEYQSSGSGAKASARSAYQLTAAEAAKFTIANIYGGAWTPSYSR